MRILSLSKYKYLPSPTMTVRVKHKTYYDSIIFNKRLWFLFRNLHSKNNKISLLCYMYACMRCLRVKKKNENFNTF